MTAPDCPRCDAASPLVFDASEPRGITRYFCECCGQVSRFDAQGRHVVPVREPEWITDAQGRSYPRED